jgi:SH3-like domain-containing protein
MIPRSNFLRTRVMSSYRRLAGWAAGALLPIFVALSMTAAHGASLDQVGPSTGLPLPRYVSLKSDRVNLREGPSQDHQTIWVFQRAGLPVEITAESDNWRKIRDSEGTEGWVLQSLLSGRRTALVAPWKKETLALYTKPSESSDIVAKLQAGVLGNVRKCDGGSWCSIFGDGFNGYIQQSNLWGVYPNEKIE